MPLDIRASKAYSNVFFTRAPRTVSMPDLTVLVTEWFPVTHAFCLGMAQYVGLFATEVLQSPLDRRDRLERAFLVPLSIAAGEFGLGTNGPEGIHYRMFARLGSALGIDINQLLARPRGRLPSTARLVDGIHGALKDLYRGAGCIQVVEASAYNIVLAMRSLFCPFLAATVPNFDESLLRYITLHLELEKEHAVIATDFVGLLADSHERKQLIEAGTSQICELFGEYWETLASHVYASEGH